MVGTKTLVGGCKVGSHCGDFTPFFSSINLMLSLLSDLEAIEEFGLKAMDWRFQCGQDLKGDELALDCSIQEIGEGVEEVEFAGLGRLKERDLLWVW